MNILTKFVVPLVAAISLTACDLNPAPSKGYKKYKHQIEQSLKTLDDDFYRTKIEWNSCVYAWIQDDSWEEAGVEENTVWYSIVYTISSRFGSNSYHVGVVYYVDKDEIQERSDITYYYSMLYDAITSGYAKGKVGTLK